MKKIIFIALALLILGAKIDAQTAQDLILDAQKDLKAAQSKLDQALSQMSGSAPAGAATISSQLLPNIQPPSPFLPGQPIKAYMPNINDTGAAPIQIQPAQAAYQSSAGKSEPIPY